MGAPRGTQNCGFCGPPSNPSNMRGKILKISLVFARKTSNLDKISTRGHARFGSGRGVQCYLLIFAQNMQPPSGNLREREPPGTLLKFKKPKPGRFPEPIFTTNHVPGPFLAVPGGCRSPFLTTNHCSRTVPGCSRSPFFMTNLQFPLGKWHFSVSEAVET